MDSGESPWALSQPPGSWFRTCILVDFVPACYFPSSPGNGRCSVLHTQVSCTSRINGRVTILLSLGEELREVLETVWIVLNRKVCKWVAGSIEVKTEGTGYQDEKGRTLSSMERSHVKEGEERVRLEKTGCPTCGRNRVDVDKERKNPRVGSLLRRNRGSTNVLGREY